MDPPQGMVDKRKVIDAAMVATPGSDFGTLVGRIPDYDTRTMSTFAKKYFLSLLFVPERRKESQFERDVSSAVAVLAWKIDAKDPWRLGAIGWSRDGEVWFHSCSLQM
jgi:hypothetical protein